jgi:hypothetical protein
MNAISTTKVIFFQLRIVFLGNELRGKFKKKTGEIKKNGVTVVGSVIYQNT